MPRTSTPTEVQPIDRLEEKVRQLVGMIDKLREERAGAAEEITRLRRELDAAHGRLADTANATAELGTLREERELIRSRVVEMISQIDRLNL
jgi:uncharacterized coiled-coil DUF342 family protein